MDDSMYESFRWLDEDADLDLSLDSYQTDALNSSPRLGQRRRPSFRRTVSFNSVHLSRKSASFISHARDPTSCGQSEPPLFTLSNLMSGRSSFSRPTSRSQPRHISQSSTSSIDPAAQYFHDPEARLKLRVYLGSPQKFDEAVQFGFPSLQDNETVVAEQTHPKTDSQGREFTGTFLEDDDTSLYDEKIEAFPNISRLSYVMQSHGEKGEPAIAEDRTQSWMSLSKPRFQRHLDTREMTLRMTLTRPDLRTDSSPPSSVTDPLRLAELSPVHNYSHIWESELDDESLVKKMWRKFRRRKY
ncbi:hypothetical protein P175DRAFT_0505546 [Aspergillus ochraceoroseus IBT 24754]|uniref:Mucin n=1 Tax=Aspergillus ochraceoroseus IBT 24754 TaxID=1392256 RepID=A0A2T5M5D5_9EURO|nr:uncharacterized protein P175DRAFT_0505546 [Aspergillus ochraceoroseus IBT 24754]PTU23750.1 hypothetical protein P175DRAFT_0505546 [Aspergillus ochraceoroseus IBT 24754]